MGLQTSAMNWRSFPAEGIDLDSTTQEERPRVLLVDDEWDTLLLLKAIFRSAGFNVLSATSGPEAVKKTIDQHPNLIMLDLMMPGVDGWQTFDQLRQMGDFPVIILSAIADKSKVVKALHIGADDYVTKPFVNAELVARAQAVLRRAGRQHPVNNLIYPAIDLRVDLRSKEVTYHDTRIVLTPKEFAILEILAKRAPAIVPYADIAKAVWEKDNDETRRRTKYLVYLLRRKFTVIDPTFDNIQNIDRLGYKLEIDAKPEHLEKGRKS